MIQNDLIGQNMTMTPNGFITILYEYANEVIGLTLRITNILAR